MCISRVSLQHFLLSRVSFFVAHVITILHSPEEGSFTIHFVFVVVCFRSIVVGAAALLGGSARLPVCLTVIMLECTGDVRYGLPLMVTLMAARWVGNLLGPSVYDIHLKLRHLPFLPWDPPKVASRLRVRDVMRHHPICLRKCERAGVVYDLLKSCTHNGFPVIEKHPRQPDSNRWVRACCCILEERIELTNILNVFLFAVFKTVFTTRSDDV